MARAQYTNSVLQRDLDANGDPIVRPLRDILVHVYHAGTTNYATIYQARTGPTEGPSPVAGAVGNNPFTTGDLGMIAFWAEAGDYDIFVTDTEAPARVDDSTYSWTPGKSVKRTNSFVIAGEIRVPSGSYDVIPPIKHSVGAGQSSNIIGLWHRLGNGSGGTSVGFSLRKNGSTLGGLTTSNTTNWVYVPYATPLADGDILDVTVTVITGTPMNLSVSIVIEDVV